MLQQQTQTILDGIVAMPRVGLYARASGEETKTQKKKDSTKNQLEALRPYAESMGWNIVSEIEEEQKNNSSVLVDIEGLQKAKRLAQTGQIDILLFRDVDRLARSQRKGNELLSFFTRLDVELRFMNQPHLVFDPSEEGMTDIMFSLQLWAAYEERKAIVRRMHAGKLAKAKAGYRPVNPKVAPYGFDGVDISPVEDKKQIVLKPNDDIAIVELIFDMYTQKRYSLHRIARELSEMQIPTPGERMKAARARKVKGVADWNHTSVRFILTNEVYTGRHKYSKAKLNKTSPAYKQKKLVDMPDIEPVIDMAVFEAAGARLAGNRHNKGNQAGDALLKSRLRCSHCGKRLKKVNLKRDKKVFSYYRCRSLCNVEPGVPWCKLPQFDAKKLENGVWQWILNLLLGKDIESYHKDYLESPEHTQSFDELANIEKLITEQQAKIESKAKGLHLVVNIEDARNALMADLERYQRTVVAPGHSLC